MKKNSLSFLLISLLVSAETLVAPAMSTMASIKATDSLPCACDDDDDARHKKDCEKDCKKNDSPEMKFWTEDNIKLLTDDDKKKLCDIQEKLKDGKCLDESDKKALFDLREKIFKCKLGDKKYAEFKKLMEKKKCGEKLSDEEECKLKEFFKELK